MNYIFILALSLFHPLLTFSQCISGDCQNGFGKGILTDKTQIEGTWKAGKANGKCKIFYPSGATYDGELVEGNLHGQGKYVYKDGASYVGQWATNMKNGKGKYTSSNGYTEDGTYQNDKLIGQATIRYSNGDTYTGQVTDSKPDGKGIYLSAGGDKFAGTYKEGKKNGDGILIYRKGGSLKGTWLNGEYVSGAGIVNRDKSKIIEAKISKNQVYEVTVHINGAYKMDMIFDTGASEVFLTPDVVLALIRAKTISNSDLLDGQDFVDANGKVNRSVRFNIREMVIGNRTIRDVACAVATNLDGLNLLGLSAIKKLGILTMDFESGEITVK